MKVKVNMDYYINHPGKMPTFTEDQIKTKLIEAGCSEYSIDPITGENIFEVSRMPDDLFLFGLKWIEVKETIEDEGII